MGRTNDKTLKEALGQMLKVYKLKRKFDETGIIAHWPDLVGKPAANRTKELFILNRKLFIRMDSSVIKNELLRMRLEIIEKINEQAEMELITEIILL
ncbi:MAG: DUF721 domain-containing protein [Sphingobacteriaceae bacterium]|nr:MAG: DUF721 domain-containing protein [Sphingobacteriaceae bacterium]